MSFPIIQLLQPLSLWKMERNTIRREGYRTGREAVYPKKKKKKKNITP
jgi:hypothetical protein